MREEGGEEEGQVARCEYPGVKREVSDGRQVKKKNEVYLSGVKTRVMEGKKMRGWRRRRRDG